MTRCWKSTLFIGTSLLVASFALIQVDAAAQEFSDEDAAVMDPFDQTPLDAKEEERRMKTLLAAEQLVQRFEEASLTSIRENQKLIFKTLEDYDGAAQEPKLLKPALLLLNARALDEKASGRALTTAWTNAVLAETRPVQRVDLLFEAASVLGQKGDRSAARTFLAQAKAYVQGERGQSDLLDIEFKVRELLVTGSSRDWREVEDEITDMRGLAVKFPVWSTEKLEILILEANLRLDAQPEEINKENNIRSIRSEARLSYSAQTQPVPQLLKDQYRTLMRRIDDIYAFDARDPNTTD